MASGFRLDWLGASLAGLVEEPGKLLVLAFVINSRKYRILNGLLLGAAVGVGHIAWSGMSAAALWRVMGSAPFRFDMLKDPRFARVFAAAVLLHMIWDSPLELPFDALYALLGAMAWIIVLGLVQEGLEELRARQAAGRAGTVQGEPGQPARQRAAEPAPGSISVG